MLCAPVAVPAGLLIASWVWATRIYRIETGLAGTTATAPVRHSELTDTIAAQPAQLPATALDHLASYLPQLITTPGIATERKAAIEALIHEIRITERGLIPVYRIPAQTA